MPSPIGHSLVGLIVFHYFKQKNLKWSFLSIVLVILVSNLPDFDFIPGILLGEPNRFHHGISHSFGFVIMITVV